MNARMFAKKLCVLTDKTECLLFIPYLCCVVGKLDCVPRLCEVTSKSAPRSLSSSSNANI